MQLDIIISSLNGSLIIAKTCVVLHIYFYGSVQMKFQVSKFKVNKLHTPYYDYAILGRVKTKASKMIRL